MAVWCGCRCRDSTAQYLAETRPSRATQTVEMQTHELQIGRTTLVGIFQCPICALCILVSLANVVCRCA